ncbi:hypothetical protein V6N13_048974 [Hibiscus sabdariffa]|uniref:Uncharacterized protein n=1 Tax=Hibiscus sabdariffa TaxID=183260 RepID=A0ABR2QYN1_9ROSI
MMYKLLCHHQHKVHNRKYELLSDGSGSFDHSKYYMAPIIEGAEQEGVLLEEGHLSPTLDSHVSPTADSHLGSTSNHDIGSTEFDGHSMDRDIPRQLDDVVRSEHMDSVVQLMCARLRR